jgi:alcohol dehydrogenase (cytochrome c)
MEHGGGMTWQPVTYDPNLNLIYVGTGNPDPTYRGDLRLGDNLYTSSIVALNSDTGKMAWYFQCSPHDTHDWDATQTPVLFDGAVDGKPRKLLMLASRNGMLFVVDRTNGEHILSKQFAESANWSKGFDAKGRPVPNPDKDSQRGGTLISPNNGGAQNWPPPTFDPETGLLYMNVAQGYEIHYSYETAGKAFGDAGHTSHAVGGLGMSLKAIDYKTGEAKWVHPYAGTEWNPPRPDHDGGLLSTAGHVLFAGDPTGFMVAYDPETGRQVWHVGLTREMTNTPITYMLDGKQYLVFAAGDELYSFSLPQ